MTEVTFFFLLGWGTGAATIAVVIQSYRAHRRAKILAEIRRRKAVRPKLEFPNYFVRDVSPGLPEMPIPKSDVLDILDRRAGLERQERNGRTSNLPPHA